MCYLIIIHSYFIFIWGIHYGLFIQECVFFEVRLEMESCFLPVAVFMVEKCLPVLFPQMVFLTNTWKKYPYVIILIWTCSIRNSLHYCSLFYIILFMVMSNFGENPRDSECFLSASADLTILKILHQ